VQQQVTKLFNATQLTCNSHSLILLELQSQLQVDIESWIYWIYSFSRNM